MTQKQLIEVINQLSTAELLPLMETIFRRLREKIELHEDDVIASQEDTREVLTQNEVEDRLATVRRLRGVFKTSGASDPNEGSRGVDTSNGVGIKSAIVRSLHGSLKFEGQPMTREEERDLVTDYLMEKYR